MVFTVTPWDVDGDVQYEKVITDFGLTKIEKPFFTNNVLFIRNVIFAHRDFQKITKALSEKKPVCLMTGLMPTGQFHIGHMLLAQEFIFFQKLGVKIYIAVADIESYCARDQDLQTSKEKAIEQYIKNYIALGLKPNNCEIYFQSNRSTDAQVSNTYYQLQNIASKHISFNEIKAVYGEITPAKINASLLQVADMIHPQLLDGKMNTFIPVGIDQDPHIRLGRDILNRLKSRGMKVEQISSLYHQFMPGLDGGKMSSSKENSYISLTDNPATIKKKINKYAFSGGKDTLEEHRKHGGNPDIDVSFRYLSMFFEPDDTKLQEIYDNYKSGKLLSGELKAIAIQKITDFITDHQKKYEKITQKDIDAFFK